MMKNKAEIYSGFRANRGILHNKRKRHTGGSGVVDEKRMVLILI